MEQVAKEAAEELVTKSCKIIVIQEFLPKALDELDEGIVGQTVQRARHCSRSRTDAGKSDRRRGGSGQGAAEEACAAEGICGAVW